MLKALNKTAKAAQSEKLRKMGAMGSTAAAKRGEHAPRKYATGGTVDMPVGGGMGKPNLSKPGRSKSKGKKGGTNVNVIVMPKPDAAPAAGPAPDMPMPAPKMSPPPPAPPMAGPPMPPPGAGGPGGQMGPGGPMPMRKSGGKVLAFRTGGKVPANIRDGEKNIATAKAHALEKGKGVGKQVKRAEGGEVDEEMSSEPIQVAGRGLGGLGRAAGAAAKAGSAASKGASGVAKTIPKSVPSSRGSGVGNVILEGEAVLNGTPGAPIGTVRRGIWDGVNILTRPKKKEEAKPEDVPQKRKAGGKVGKMMESATSHDDKKADEALIRKMVKPAAMKAKASK